MNNYPSSYPSLNSVKPLFPAYGEQQQMHSPNRTTFGSYGSPCNETSYGNKIQSPHLFHEQRGAYMNSHGSPANIMSRNDFARRPGPQRSSQQHSYDRYNQSSSQFIRRTQSINSSDQYSQNKSFSQLSPLYLEKSAMEHSRTTFSNMMQHQNAPRQESFGKHSTVTSPQKLCDSLNFFQNLSPVDPVLKAKFQRHVQNEMLDVAFEDLPGSSSSLFYQNDFSCSKSNTLVHKSNLNILTSRTMPFKNDALYSDLPNPVSKQESFKEDFSGNFHENNHPSSNVLNFVKDLPQCISVSESPVLKDDDFFQREVKEQKCNFSNQNEKSCLKSLSQENNADNKDMHIYFDESIQNKHANIQNTSSAESVFKTCESNLKINTNIEYSKTLTNDFVKSVPEIPVSKTQSFSSMQLSSVENSNQECDKFEKDVSLSVISSALSNLDEDSLDKLLEVASKNNSFVSNNPSVSKNINVSTNEWTKSDFIPFLGETLTSKTDTAISSESNINMTSYVNMQEPTLCQDSVANCPNLEESGVKNKPVSALENALETLMIKEPIVGLDYITEHKDILSVEESFPFHCKLCDTSVPRSHIIEHIQLLKHRLNYVKIKDAPSYNYFESELTDQNEKEVFVYKTVAYLEKQFGRGHVVVKLESLSDDSEKSIGIKFERICNDKTAEQKIDDDLALTLNAVDENVNKPIVHIERKECLIESNYFTSTEYNKSGNCAQKKEKQLFVEAKADDFMKKESELEKSFVHPSNEKICQLNYSNEILPKESTKRPVSPFNEGPSKSFKSDDSTEQDNSKSIISFESELDKMPKEDSSDKSDMICTVADGSQTKDFYPSYLEELSKCEISSDQEASYVLHAIDALMKMLLRYKLQHVTKDAMENMMQLLEETPLEKLDELSDLMKDRSSTIRKLQENLSINVSNSSTPAKNLNSDSDCGLKEDVQKDVTEKISPGFLNSSNEITVNEINQQKENKLLTSADKELPGAFNQSTNLSNNVTCSDQKTLISNEVMTDLPLKESNVVSHSLNISCLQPPPFFQWPDLSIASTSSVVSSASLQNNMAWSTPYQQSQIAGLSSYPHTTFVTKNPAFQQFPVILPQPSVPTHLQLGVPLPPLPPLPPPISSQVPLPPPPPVPSPDSKSPAVAPPLPKDLPPSLQLPQFPLPPLPPLPPS